MNMLKRQDFINKLGEEYTDMFKQISIPDFTKCIAQYSGISMEYLKDEMIEEYLTHWAINKKHIFNFLGGKVKVDIPIDYKEEVINSIDTIMDIAKDYPVYYPWLNMLRKTKDNKIDLTNMGWESRDIIMYAFPGVNVNNMTLTRFLKQHLKAPDDMVTAIGRIWENSTIKANFTLSIDPVDIMLSSETPYNWSSCYRLEHFCESHADGCLAGVLDSATIITYIWDKEGKYQLYNYDFKNIRYKRMRMTIAINKDFNAVHFNEIYPGKCNLSDAFHKTIRGYVEKFIADKLGKDNTWKNNDRESYDSMISADRQYDNYGYDEYSRWNVYYLKGFDTYSDINGIYDTVIHCPCGCGEDFIGSSAYDDYEYNGDGQINDNYYERYDNETWCSYLDDYQDCDGDCRNCCIYNEHNMVCELDTNEQCDRDLWDAQEQGDFDPYESNIVTCNPEHCAECPLYKYHHPEEEKQEEEEVTIDEVNQQILNAILEQPAKEGWTCTTVENADLTNLVSSIGEYNKV